MDFSRLSKRQDAINENIEMPMGCNVEALLYISIGVCR